MKENKVKKIAVILGTRPEVIKLAPVILEFKKYPENFEVEVVSSGQHSEMLDKHLLDFAIKADYELNLMRDGQTLFDLNQKMLPELEKILIIEKPELVLVQGDTLTAFIASTAAFYLKIPVAHIEAGLRTYQKYNPFPEEINRQLIDILSDYFFVPTDLAKQNLLNEGKPKDKIFITGNTVIDAALVMSKKVKKFKKKYLKGINFKHKKIIVLECHRRESWGKELENIFEGVKKIAQEFKEVEVLFPVHLNPQIQKKAEKIFKDIKNIHLLEILNYQDMILLLKKCYLVVTDSGGLQEEAAFFKKPVVVLRNVTERTEGILSGNLILGTTDRDRIYRIIKKLLTDKKLYKKMSAAKNPFGDGKSSIRIRKILQKIMSK